MSKIKSGRLRVSCSCHPRTWRAEQHEQAFDGTWRRVGQESSNSSTLGARFASLTRNASQALNNGLHVYTITHIDTQSYNVLWWAPYCYEIIKIDVPNQRPLWYTEVAKSIVKAGLRSRLDGLTEGLGRAAAGTESRCHGRAFPGGTWQTALHGRRSFPSRRSARQTTSRTGQTSGGRLLCFTADPV